MEFVVVAGTYEHILYGFYCLENDKDDTKQKMELRLDPMFIYSSHLNGITCLTNHKNLLASGSADETVKIYDLKKRMEVGTLIQHNGAVNATEFYGGHMLSGGQDGTICIWDAKRWECLVTLKAHKGGVIDFSVHPSGKVALSIGKDKSMKMWDLVLGKSAFKSRLVRAPQMVRWSPGGDVYCLVDETKFTIYTADDNTVTHTIETPRKIVSLAFITPKLVALGCEEGFLQVWDIVTGEMTHNLVGHKVRVRGLSVTHLPLVEDAVEGKQATKLRHFLVSGSSEGVVKVWEVPLPEEGQLQPIVLKQPKAEVNVDARITSVASALVFEEIVEETEHKQAGEKKPKVKKVKQTTRVVVEDESQEGQKKRKRGASPGPAKKGKPGNSPAKKGKPQGKRPRNEQAETGDGAGQGKTSRFSKRMEKEEKMITAAVFGSPDAKPKKNKPSDQGKLAQKGGHDNQHNQQLNSRARKAPKEGSFSPRGGRGGGRGGRGGSARGGRGGGRGGNARGGGRGGRGGGRGGRRGGGDF